MRTVVVIERMNEQSKVETIHSVPRIHYEMNTCVDGVSQVVEISTFCITCIQIYIDLRCSIEFKHSSDFRCSASSFRKIFLEYVFIIN